MKFNGSQAWEQATAWLRANRDVVIAIAGVFFLLPSLVTSVFGPQPPAPVAGQTAQQLVQAAQQFYLGALPYFIPALLLQAIGLLALLTLFTDARRPTVGVAIRQSLAGFLWYVAAQLLPGFAMGIAAALIFVAAGFLAVILGSAMAMPLIVAALAIGVALSLYVFVRCSLCGPVIAVEHTRNPLTALARSWTLTRGNAGRLVLFYLLVGVLFIVIAAVINTVLGIVLGLALSRPNALLVADIVSSLVSTTATVFIAAILAAVHRQLAGPAADHRVTFG